MTLANEYIPEGEGQEAAGPAIFGITMTPQILGGILAVLGIGLAAYVGYQFVLPKWQERDKLLTDIKAKNDSIAQQQERLKERKKAEDDKKEAERRKSFVTDFFASASTLETLLFDVNEIVAKINAGIKEDDKQAKLMQFDPVIPPPTTPQAAAQGVPPDPSIVNDSSLGPGVNGKLKRKEYKVKFEGTFAQTRAFLMGMEQMQPLLVVRNMNSGVAQEDTTQRIEVKIQEGGKVVPVKAPEPLRLITEFSLHALVPLTENDRVAATPTPAASPSPAPVKK